MTHHLYLLLPLVWSLEFALGGVMLKRALDNGTGALRMAFVCNVMLGLLMLPGVFTIHAMPTADVLFWPILVSLIYFVGQVLTFLIIRIGDVTILAPVMGSKVVFVAVFTFMLSAGPMPWNNWASAFLATIAVFLLGMSDWQDRKRVMFTAGLTVIAASLYAMCDILVQQHAGSLGALGFAAVMLGFNAIVSFGLIPFFREPLGKIPRAAWKWTLWGAVIISTQSGGMAFTLGQFKEATAVNVVYSTRGLWSILLVWAAGSWFGVKEGGSGSGVMARRLAGALLLLVALVLVLTANPNSGS